MAQEIMTTRQASEYLQLAIPTLETWRRLKKGPPFTRLGRAVRYRKSDLDDWLTRRKVEEEVR